MDLLGQRLDYNVMNAAAGEENSRWQRKDLTHGVYLVRLTRPDGEAKTMRLIVE